MSFIRIGTRKSQLALWQAEYVQQRLQAISPGLHVRLVKMTTQGDRKLDTPLAKVGGKGLFTKELEQGLLDGHIDLAVHSLKDVTLTLPEGLHIPVVCEREDARDVFVSNAYPDLAALPRDARIGTSSLRRQSQLRHRWPHLQIINLRGNVNSRLTKLDTGEFDALILAAAGLKRLGWASRIRRYLEPEHMLPAVGQGAICIECRRDHREINRLLAPLNHIPTQICIQAERAMNARLEGGCQIPIAGYAQLDQDRLRLRGLVGAPDGSRIIYAEKWGADKQAEQLGISVASELLAQGAQTILDQVYGRP